MEKKVSIVPPIENFHISLSPQKARNLAVTPRSVRSSLSSSDGTSLNSRRKLQKCKSVFGKNLTETQFGERRGRKSIIDNIYNLKEIVDKNLEEFLVTVEQLIANGGKSQTTTENIIDLNDSCEIEDTTNLIKIRDIAKNFLDSSADFIAFVFLI